MLSLNFEKNAVHASDQMLMVLVLGASVDINLLPTRTTNKSERALRF